MSFPGEGQSRGPKKRGPRTRAATNVEFVRDLMEYSAFGALAQLFVIDALDKWAHKIGNMPVEELRKAFGENSMVHPDAWHGVANEIAKKIRER